MDVKCDATWPTSDPPEMREVAVDTEEEVETVAEEAMEVTVVEVCFKMSFNTRRRIWRP